MQMKMPKRTEKFDSKAMLGVLKEETDFITKLCESLEVPETLENDDEFDMYLTNSKKAAKKFTKQAKAPAHQKTARSKAEEARVQNKLKAKKGGLKKSKRNKDKKDMKKRLVSAAKAVKNEKVKEEKLEEGEDKKPAKPKEQFNKEGKIVFSKVEFPTSGSKFDQPKKKKKKGDQDKIEKNPLRLIKKLKAQKDEIKELEASGDKQQASEMKKDLAWKKVFDKTEGRKIRDDPELIMKGLKQRRAQKKKSKQEWKGRKEKVEKGIEDRQKKRQANIDKKIQDKKNKKLKTLAKRGRVIPGF